MTRRYVTPLLGTALVIGLSGCGGDDNSDNITGKVTQELPVNTLINTPYPVTFTYTNESDVDATGVYVLNTSDTSVFTVDSNTCNDTLDAHSSCVVSGTMMSTTPESVTVSHTLSYDQGGDIYLETSSVSSEVAINGLISQALPNNTAINTPYPVTFTYTNESDNDATGVYVLNTSDTSVFTVDSNTCNDTLDAHSSCVVSGTMMSTTPEIVTVSHTLSYDQGSDVMLETISTSAEIAVTGSVIEDLPINTTIDTSYPVTFRFTNDSEMVATGLNVVDSSDKAIFTVDSNECQGTLDSHSSCVVTGTMQSALANEVTVAIAVNYDQAALATSLQSTSWVTGYTEVSEVVITGELTNHSVFSTSETLDLDTVTDNNHMYLVHESLQNDQILSFVEKGVWANYTPNNLLVNVSGEEINLQFSMNNDCESHSINSGVECVGVPKLNERHVKLTLTEEEFDKIPIGSHSVNLILSNKLWHSEGYQHMVIIPIRFDKS